MSDLKLIGVSLPLCILQIAEGKIDRDNVSEIISACTSEAFLTRVLPEYRKGYWRTLPKETVQIAVEFYGQGKIKFPRDGKADHFPVTPDMVLWVNSPKEIVWFDQ
ncbi:hypothetical protein QT972_25480 [Microcoleus sp. herbarium7]|uniref:hypothetical protein n=1 Tax=Microcoleus sp. herbarium7 TaxID=3055435 RepID=UPI002FD1D461